MFERLLALRNDVGLLDGVTGRWTDLARRMTRVGRRQWEFPAGFGSRRAREHSVILPTTRDKQLLQRQRVEQCAVLEMTVAIFRDRKPVER
jgi:hypothetical protein